MRRAAGVAALLLYVIHATELIRRGEPYDLLWGCHLAALLVGVGLLLERPRLNAVGVLWSCFGLPLWIIYLFSGDDVMLSSAFTHLGALALGVYGVRQLGMPRGSAGAALAAYFALWMLTRVATPAWANVNLAFRVYPGWERWFHSYPIYFATLFALAAVVFLVFECFFRRFVSQVSPADSAAMTVRA
jgi:hypothetical protein